MTSLRSVLLGGIALAAAVTLAGPATAGAAVATRTVCVPHDRQLDEASGLAAGIASPGVLYAQNDSGDRNWFFALDASEVAVYRVAEPTVGAGRRGAAISTARADVWRLRYPGGPVDAESLAVAPGGTGYVVTKSLSGRSTVYRLPPRPDARRVQLLRPVPAGDVAAAIRRRPTVLALPAQPQGDGVAVGSGRLLANSEGVGTPIDAVALPAGVRAAAAAAAATSSAASSATSAGSSSGASGTPSSGASTPAGASSGSGSWLPGIIILVLLIAMTVAWLLGQRGNGRRAGP
jgi:hypothetical protein